MSLRLALIPFAVLLFVLPFPGTVALRLLCLATASIAALIYWTRLIPPVMPMKRILFAWAAVAVASLPNAYDPAYTLGEIKNEVGYTMMSFIAFFAISSNGQRLKWLLLGLTSGALVLCTWALARVFLLGHWDTQGGHGGVAAFATYFATITPALLLLGFYFRDARLQTLMVVTLLLLAVTGFYSEQRIVWPVFFLQLLTATIISRKSLGFSNARVVIALVLAVLLAAAGILGSQISRFDKNPFPSVTIENDSRLAFWPKVAGRIIDHPLIGIGFGRGAMQKAYPDLIPDTNTELWHAHNVILNYGLQMGVPGMIVLIIIFAELWRQYSRFLRSTDPELRILGACGVVLVVGVLARNMVNDMFLRDATILFWALNGMLLGLGYRKLAA